MDKDSAQVEADTLFERGRSFLRAGDHDHARHEYQRAVKLAPHHAEALHGLGVIEFREGQLERAAKLMSRSVEIKPDFGNAHFNLGNVYRQMGRRESALHHFSVAVALMPSDSQARGQLGSVLLSLGRTNEAVSALTRALALDPSNADAWAHQGYAQMDLEAFDAAIESFRRGIALRPGEIESIRALAECEGRLGRYHAVASTYQQLLSIAPSDVPAHHRLALALEASGSFDQALGVLNRADGLRPNDATTLLARASVLQKLQRWREALRDYDEILINHPNHLEAGYQRGRCLLECGRLDQAMEVFNQVIDSQPAHALAYAGRGDVLYSQKRTDEAIAAYLCALSYDDGLAEVHNNLAVALHQSGDLPRAFIECQRALELAPNLALAHANQGSLLRDLRRLDEAVATLRQALALQPSLAVAERILGDVYRLQGTHALALEALQRALSIDASDADAHMTCGHVLFDLQRYEDAVAEYDSALAIKPDLEFLRGLRLFTKLYVCNWQGFEEEHQTLIDLIGSGEMACAPFPSLVLFDSAALQQKIARAFSKAKFGHLKAPDEIKPYPKHKKIRVGYFSADFFEHATTHLMIDLFERHDRDAFELIAISFGPDVRDTMRQRLEEGFDQFHDVRRQSDQQVADLARHLEIDIAVDLKGYTAHYRPAIFVLRCAPVQVSYLGYPGTLEMQAMDYLIADQITVPKQHRCFYREKLAYLPVTYQPNDTGRKIADRAFSRAELNLPEQAFVFCCFNNNFKVLPRVFSRWMQILDLVPESVLWLLGDNPTVICNLRREAERRGIDAERLVFGKRLPSSEHLARHRAADLFLDSLPYNAHTTTSDALWTGLPVLTLMGASFASRVAASLLHAVHLPELITHTEEEYVATAVSLAQDRGRLAKMSSHLRERQVDLPLFDIERFARDLEAIYLRMHETASAGLPPEHIEPVEV